MKERGNTPLVIASPDAIGTWQSVPTAIDLLPPVTAHLALLPSLK